MTMPSDDMLHELADELMFLKRTKYSEWTELDLPFHAAFFELMKKYKIMGGDWYVTRQAIGSILGKRPRRGKKPQPSDFSVGITQPQIEFSVVERNTARVVLMSPMGGDKITYVRVRGVPQASAWEGNIAPLARNIGLMRAQEIFLEEDEKQAKSEFRIWLLSKDDEKIIISIDERFVYTAQRGKRGAVVGAMKDLSGKSVKQMEADADLLRFAKASARHHFKDTRTADMFA